MAGWQIVGLLVVVVLLLRQLAQGQRQETERQERAKRLQQLQIEEDIDELDKFGATAEEKRSVRREVERRLLNGDKKATADGVFHEMREQAERLTISDIQLWKPGLRVRLAEEYLVGDPFDIDDPDDSDEAYIFLFQFESVKPDKTKGESLVRGQRPNYEKKDMWEPFEFLASESGCKTAGAIVCTVREKMFDQSSYRPGDNEKAPPRSLFRHRRSAPQGDSAISGECACMHARPLTVDVHASR